MRVISNSSPLIFLAKIKKLDLLKKLFKKVIIPQEVYDEIVVKNTEETERIKMCKFLSVVKVKKISNVRLDIGETAAILLAKKENANLLVMDDNKARNLAENYKIKTIGTLGILLLALSQKLINKEEFSGLLSELIKNNFRISIEVYNKVLEESRKL